MKILTENGLTELITLTQSALATKQASLPTASTNEFLHTNATTGALEWVDTAAASTLDVDTAPANNSHLITSGGVYTALASKEDVSTIDNDSEDPDPTPAFTLANNTIYQCTSSAITSLTISGIESGFQYATIQFTSNTGTATTFSMPADPATPTPTTHYYCVGTDCSNGTFTPVASTRYNLAVEQEADRIAIYVMEAE